MSETATTRWGAGGFNTRHERANALHDAGDIPGAIATLTKIVAEAPWDYPAWRALAAYQIEVGNFAEALVAAREAIRHPEEGKKPVSGHINAGIALRGLRRLEESRQHLETAIHLEPTAPLAHCQLAQTLQCNGQDRRAAIHYFLAIVYAPRSGPNTDGRRPDEIIAKSIEGVAGVTELTDWPPFLRALPATARAIRSGRSRTPQVHRAIMDLFADAETSAENAVAQLLLAHYWKPRP